MAERMVARLREDLKQSEKSAGVGSVCELACLTDLEAAAIVKSPHGPEAQAASRAVIQIITGLQMLVTKDEEAMLRGMDAAEKIANGAPADYTLAQRAGIECTMSFEMLVSLFVCETGDATMRVLNPSFLGDDARLQQLSDVTAAVQLLAARVGHARRGLAIAHRLQETMGELAISPTPTTHSAIQEAQQSLVQRGAALADCIVSKRCYMKSTGAAAGGIATKKGAPPPPGGASGKVTFDPRFLAFEYALNLLLRAQQAGLIQEFVTAAKTGNSRVHQMIMGAGKSTVVCPLLALMLGNNNTLVMQVVPVALLEFSRSVMRERFSSLLRKPVYTFTFDRFTAASPQLLSKILHARRLSAVMLTSPTSLKSFVLKFIETVHLLESCSNQDEEEDLFLGHEAVAGLMNRVGGPRRGSRRGSVNVTKSEQVVVRSRTMLPQLAAQARVACAIVAELQESLLILDEVDLILHPLKSELNWPLGKRKPLDFGATRWAVPFHLLDALFFCSNGVVPDAWRNNRIAMALLKKLKAAVDKGFEVKHLQRTPHLILISTVFYKNELKQLLCRWMLLLLRKFKLRELRDEQVLSFLAHGGRAHASTTEEIETTLKDRTSRCSTSRTRGSTSCCPTCSRRSTASTTAC